RRKHRPHSAECPIAVATSDGEFVHLTHYQGKGLRGPVLLVPGFTTTASSFDTPTVETSLVGYLWREGFDVWLLDYRASPAFLAAWKPFTIDDIALRDYPAAVRAVHKETGQKVQIVAHCVGSISLFMSLLEGQVQEHVTSVVASQVAG